MSLGVAVLTSTPACLLLSSAGSQGQPSRDNRQDQKRKAPPHSQPHRAGRLPITLLVWQHKQFDTARQACPSQLTSRSATQPANQRATHLPRPF